MLDPKRKFVFYVLLTVSICLTRGFLLQQARAETVKSSRDGEEKLHKALHELLTIFKTYTPCETDTDYAAQIEKLEQRLDKLNREELANLTRSFDVTRFVALVEKLKARITQMKGEEGHEPVRSPLEPPNYEDICPPPRVPSTVLIGFILVVAALEEAENTSAIVCETGNALPIEGINTPACVAALFAESLAIVGRTALALFVTCSDSIDSAEIEAGWKNTVNIHEDLAAYSEKIGQRLNAVEQKLNAISIQLQKILSRPTDSKPSSGGTMMRGANTAQ